MTESTSKFEKQKKKIEEYYMKLNSVRCPYFSGDVHFSSGGFRHLIYKGGKKRKLRELHEIYARFRLLSLAPKLLSITTTLQEFEIKEQKVSVREREIRKKLCKEVRYWGFVAILQKKKIKVVIRQIGNGQKHFWSIFPNWVTRKKSDKGLVI